MSLRKFTTRANTRPTSKSFYEYDKGFSVDIPRTKEVKPSGLGKKPYTVYVIDLHHGDEEFQSDLRYSDFRKLHAVIRQRFPNLELPHLPSKKYVGNNTSDEFVQKRKLKLERYLRVLLANRDVRYSSELPELLGLPKRLSAPGLTEVRPASKLRNESATTPQATSPPLSPSPAPTIATSASAASSSSTLQVPGMGRDPAKTDSIYTKEYLSDASSGEESDEEKLPRGVALFRFGFEEGDAEQGYLKMNEGDEVVVVEQHESGWWTGERNGLIGYFPSDYVQMLPAQSASAGTSAESDPEEQTLPGEESDTEQAQPQKQHAQQVGDARSTPGPHLDVVMATRSDGNDASAHSSRDSTPQVVRRAPISSPGVTAAATTTTTTTASRTAPTATKRTATTAPTAATYCISAISASRRIFLFYFIGCITNNGIVAVDHRRADHLASHQGAASRHPHPATLPGSAENRVAVGGEPTEWL